MVILKNFDSVALLNLELVGRPGWCWTGDWFSRIFLPNTGSIQFWYHTFSGNNISQCSHKAMPVHRCYWIPRASVWPVAQTQEDSVRFGQSEDSCGLQCSSLSKSWRCSACQIFFGHTCLKQFFFLKEKVFSLPKIWSLANLEELLTERFKVLDKDFKR